MKIHAKNDEKWCFRSVLSEERAREDPENFLEPNELGLGRAQLLYMNPKAVAIERPSVALQGLSDLRKCAEPGPILAIPLIFDMFPITLE